MKVTDRIERGNVDVNLSNALLNSAVKYVERQQEEDREMEIW